MSLSLPPLLLVSPALFPYPSDTATQNRRRPTDQASLAGAQCQPSCILSPHLASFVCFSFSPRCITLHTLYAFFSHFPFCLLYFTLLLSFHISSSALSETHPASHQTRHLLFIRDVTSCFWELLRLYIPLYTLNARRLRLTVLSSSKQVKTAFVILIIQHIYYRFFFI